MRAHEVADVDVVADAGAVGRRVIGAVDVDLRPQPERGLDRDLDQVRRVARRLAGAQVRVGARDVEVAQDHVVETMGGRGVLAA